MWAAPRSAHDGRRVADLLHSAASALHDTGCDTPSLDAEVLLAHTLGWDRARLLAHPEHCLTAPDREAFASILARRQSREPLPYITGHREFFGLEFAVDHRVLVPRPETEVLVEQTLKWVRSRQAGQGQAGRGMSDHGSRPPLPVSPGSPSIADVGTGSGCIALALALHLPRATIYALDSSAGALEVAASNVARHGLQGRVLLLHSDLLGALPSRVSAIVANLPYVRTGELTTLEPETRDHEPQVALDGGPTGLEPSRRLLAQAAPHLLPGGAIMLETGDGQGRAAAEMARREFPRAKVDVLPDYAGRDRVLRILT